MWVILNFELFGHWEFNFYFQNHFWKLNWFENKNYFGAHFALGPMTQATLVYLLRKVVCFVIILRSPKLWCSVKISQTLWRCDQGSTYRWFYCMYEWRNNQGGREAKMKFTTNSVIDKINNDHVVVRWMSLQKKEKTLDGEGGEYSGCTWHKSCMSQGTEKSRRETVMVDWCKARGVSSTKLRQHTKGQVINVMKSTSSQFLTLLS